jgi:hypothetical protein
MTDNVVGFHPKNKLVNFYEIATEEGNAVWGGEDPHSAVQWLRQSPLELTPVGVLLGSRGRGCPP